MNVFSTWIFALLVFLSSPEKREAWQVGIAYKGVLAEQVETATEGRARYWAIAQDLAAVVQDPETKPLYGGKLGRARTAALVLAIAHMESGFRVDVDLGLGKKGRGDNGRSWCLMQVQTGKGEGTVPVGGPVVTTWTGADLVADRKKCFRAGIEMIRVSLTSCKALATPDRLSAYTTGSCRHGQPESQARLSLADRILRILPAPRWTAPANDTHTLPPAAPANDNAVSASVSARTDGTDRVASGL